MKQIRNYSLLASAMLTFALTSCNNDEVETIPYEGPVLAQVTAGIDGALTRASDTSWDQNDAIGITCRNTENETNYDNKKYVTASGNGTFTHYNATVEDLAGGIFFQGTGDVSFFAYYPFTGTDGTLPGTNNGIISGSTQKQVTNQKSLDYLYAAASTTYATPTISFTGNDKFKHKMARLKLVLQTDANAGFSVEDVKSGTYTLGGLKHDGTFNVIEGKAKTTPDASPVANWSVSTNCPYADANNQRTYTMFLYPQTVSGPLPFTATISSQNYNNTADIKFTDNELSSGNSYTFTITIKKTGLAVSSCTIEGWGTEVTGSGNAGM
ncbi:fimbrillin family protein [Bacteroides intestinalis]|uniref:fimbrillin family protein n=1 Tax=Bacteroides intestinalis TaxID=329854 RepID=UPI00189CE5E9|nr:fimbrillin family protein [Bacteroides intestinalis]